MIQYIVHCCRPWSERWCTAVVLIDRDQTEVCEWMELKVLGAFITALHKNLLSLEFHQVFVPAMVVRFKNAFYIQFKCSRGQNWGHWKTYHGTPPTVHGSTYVFFLLPGLTLSGAHLEVQKQGRSTTSIRALFHHLEIVHRPWVVGNHPKSPHFTPVDLCKTWYLEYHRKWEYEVRRKEQEQQMEPVELKPDVGTEEELVLST